jgi:acetate kinase
MEWCGLRLDPDRNAGAVGARERISADDAGLHAYVIPVDESILIAEHTVTCLQDGERRKA